MKDILRAAAANTQAVFDAAYAPLPRRKPAVLLLLRPSNFWKQEKH